MSRRSSTTASVKSSEHVRCAVYTRKSSEEGLEQSFNSLHAQRQACEAYILSQAGEGWAANAEVYDDGGFSGGNLERPALKRLLADIEAGLIDIVVLYKIDRLTRSLSDFAQLVQVFERGGASFVSVTQAFNTTTSMGRLTLNMLLSFAQFEREVTSERIRDKIAASKAQGMWMGGMPPLGYDPDGRTLKIVESEAHTVRYIFDRYLELRSVQELRTELERDGIRSKHWVSRATGKVYEARPLLRGALYYLLSNRIYLGEIAHKSVMHPGRHPPIISSAVFKEAQERLAENGGGRRQEGLSTFVSSGPLAGLIRDDRGNVMSPAAARTRQSVYRYYVSTAVQTGRPAEAGSLHRTPAKSLERLILDRFDLLLGPGPDDEWSRVRGTLIGVEVSCHQVVLTLDRTHLGLDTTLLALRTAGLPSTDRISTFKETLILTCGTAVKRRAGGKVVVGPNGAPAVEASTVDLILLRALVRAEAWKAQLVSGEIATLAMIAEREGIQRAYARRMLRLAFLSPGLKRSILQGRTGLTLQGLMDKGVPDLWSEQERRALS